MKHIMILLVLSCITFSAKAYSEKSILVTDTISISNNKVDYKVTDNKSNITVNISTQDTKTIMIMLHHGVTVFFDLKGKEKENVSLKYPLEPLRLPMKPEDLRADDFQTEAEVNKIKHDIYKLVTTDFPEEAEFHYFDKKDNFNVLLNSLNITALYSYNENSGVLTYQLTIPKNKLKEKTKEDFSNLLIGVKTVMPDRNKKEDRSNNLEASGGNRPSGGGGGPGGSGGGPGGGRGGSQNQQRPDEGDSKEKIGIDFWFEAHM